MWGLVGGRSLEGINYKSVSPFPTPPIALHFLMVVMQAAFLQARPSTMVFLYLTLQPWTEISETKNQNNLSFNIFPLAWTKDGTSTTVLLDGLYHTLGLSHAVQWDSYVCITGGSEPLSSQTNYGAITNMLNYGYQRCCSSDENGIKILAHWWQCD